MSWGCTTQFQQQPIGTGMKKQPELVGLPAMAGSSVGFGVEFVLLDPLSGRACLHAREEGFPYVPEHNRPFRKDACCGRPPRLVTMKRTSVPCREASTRAMTRRSFDQLLAPYRVWKKRRSFSLFPRPQRVATSLLQGAERVFSLLLPGRPRI